MRRLVLGGILLLAGHGAGAQETFAGSGTMVECSDNTIRKSYTGPRYPRNTEWKVPIQILSGYTVGFLSATLAIGYYSQENAPKRTDAGGGAAGDFIFSTLAFFLVGLPVFTITNPIPISIIGNVGNEKSSVGMTYLGSAGGMLLPFIGGPIGATIMNRSSRTYKYYCVDPGPEPAAPGSGIRILRPTFGFENGEPKYGIRLIELDV